MPQPSPDVDPLFDDLWQDWPAEAVQMAREFKAFSWARKINTPVQRLRVVLLSGGLDTSRREVAGHGTLRMERITASSIAERLAACRPWVRALLCRMLPRVAGAERPAQRRFLVIDGRGIQGPGARRGLGAGRSSA